jgi:hypothetical protein
MTKATSEMFPSNVKKSFLIGDLACVLATPGSDGRLFTFVAVLSGLPPGRLLSYT